jgi:ATP-dependent Clp protease adaptor protein ClpS
MPKRANEQRGDTATEEVVRVKQPKQFKVVLLNDDYTTMEFVVHVLETIFLKTPSEAVQIMLHVHKQGRGVAGVFSKQIAEAKIEMVHQRARSEGFPLRCIMEEV